MSEQIVFKVVDVTDSLYQDALNLRDIVLRQPLNLKFTKAELEKDKHASHIVGLKEDTVVGVLVMQKLSESVYKMRQVAVSPSEQKQGIGQKMVIFSEAFAKQQQANKIELNARDIAVPFYLKLDYEIVGEQFEEVGIPHFKMIKQLK